MTAPAPEVPTWRLCEELRREAREAIDGRKSFERHFGRESAKPLKQIEIDPRYVVQLLDHMDKLERMAEAAGEKDEE